MENKFHKIIGYTSIGNIDNEKLARKIFIIKDVVNAFYSIPRGRKGLVAGCGNGEEAKLIKSIFGLETFGVDISLSQDFIVENGCSLYKQDLRYLSFENDFFDFEYCYHVLEHVPDPHMVLIELSRVLKPYGILFIGFPNKRRLFGYVGAHNNVSWHEKMKWNLNDYKARLNGKFENSLGAHAGFGEKEFVEMSSKIFSKIIPVRNEYMLLKYSNRGTMLKMIISNGLSEFLFPSNYFICIK